MTAHRWRRFAARFFVCLAVLFCFAVSCAPAAAAEEESGDLAGQIYEEQLEKSGAGDLRDTLPDEVEETLNGIGVTEDFRSVEQLTPKSFFSAVFGVLGKEGATPMKAAASCVAVMLLCAMVSAMKLSLGEDGVSSVVGVVGTLCVCICIVEPLVYAIVQACAVIKTAAGFSLAAIPVMAGILLAGGKPASAASWQILMTAAGNGVELISAGFLAPAMRMFLGVSVVSSISPDLHLGGLCKTFQKGVKWILGFAMTLFTGLLTMRGMISAALDTTGTRAAKFMVSSFVPVVGSALGEAIHTVASCVNLLKSGVGAFALLAEVIIFLPSLLSCLVWMLTLTCCAALGDIFDLKELSGLLRSCCSVMETLLAILLCSMTILTVSGVMLMMAGGGGGT